MKEQEVFILEHDSDDWGVIKYIIEITPVEETDDEGL